MPACLTRRHLVALLAATALPFEAPASAEAGRFGPPEPFDYRALVDRARALGASAYVARPEPTPSVLDRLDYGPYGEIRATTSVVRGSSNAISPFHLGRFFRRPVRLHVVVDGISREYGMRRGDFAFDPSNPAADMPEDAGFAGFRIHDDGDIARKDNDWLAFLGASYFRSCGDGGQYGLSARGIAVDVAPERPGAREEFPDFTDFWVAPVDGAGRTTILALLDGPSLAGAYRFDVVRKPHVVMDVECALFLRRDVERLGIAPLTSMFWYGKPYRWGGDSVRPEVHDSDGLSLWNGDDEQIYRPLVDQDRVTVSSFSDIDPKAFGLVQRERRHEMYEDDVLFERRPDAVVEPKGRWGKGAVELVELPTSKEYEDNVVAFWRPERKASAGDSLRYEYRLRWPLDEGFPGDVARCGGVKLDLGSTREMMKVQATDYEFWRMFVVDFQGAVLADYDPGDAEMVLTLSRGRVHGRRLSPSADSDRTKWRAWFDMGCDGEDAVEIRLFLRSSDGRTLTETVAYQLHPKLHFRTTSPPF